MMNIKRTFGLLALFTLLSLSTFAQSWTKDPMHSRLGFVVSRGAMLDVTGVFKEFTITMDANAPDFSDAKVVVEVPTASIDTYVKMRDDHLRSADFLDVEKYPTMTFKSTGIKKTGDNTFELVGDITLHGVTKPQTFIMKNTGFYHDDKSKKDIAGFKVTGKLNRADFGVGPNFPSAIISDNIEIVVDVLMQK